MAKKKANVDKECESSAGTCSESKKTAGLKKKDREMKKAKQPVLIAPVPIAPAPEPVAASVLPIAPAPIAPVTSSTALITIAPAVLQITPGLIVPASLPMSPLTIMPTTISMAPGLIHVAPPVLPIAPVTIMPTALPIAPRLTSPPALPIAPGTISNGTVPTTSTVSIASVQDAIPAATLVPVPPASVAVHAPHTCSPESPTLTLLTKVEMDPHIKTEDTSSVYHTCTTYSVATQNDFDSADVFNTEHNGLESDMVVMPMNYVKAEVVSQEELAKSDDLNKNFNHNKDPYTPDFDADVNITVLPPINRKRPYKPPLLTNHHKSTAALELEAEINDSSLAMNCIDGVMSGNTGLPKKKSPSKRKTNDNKNTDGSTTKKKVKKEKDVSLVTINNVVNNLDDTCRMVSENGEVLENTSSESGVKSKVPKPKLIADDARKFSWKFACEKCGRKFKSENVCGRHQVKCGLPKPPRPSKRMVHVEQTAKLPEQESQEAVMSLEGTCNSTPGEMVQTCAEGLSVVTDGQIILNSELADSSAPPTAVTADAQPKPSKPKQLFKCSQCEYVNSKKAVLVNHLETLHQMYRCLRVKCVFETDSKEVLEQHAQTEHKSMPVRRPDMKKCKKCSKYIKCDVEPLEVHTEQCKGREPYMCQQCNKEFKYKFAYTNHMHSHKPALEPKKFSCIQCEYTSNFKANLQKHINCIHEQRTKDVPCPECDKLFYTDEKMKKHKLLHTDVRPFTCDICQKAFKTKMTLRSHKDIHNMERKFTCTLNGCTKDFRTMQTLRKHQHMYHELQAPPKKFACTFEGCTQNFFKAFHLKRHARTHSDERKFKCEWEGCGKAFRHEDNLTVHYRQHTNETPYSCSHCSFSCKQKTSLRYHLQTHHKPTESIENKQTAMATSNADLPETSVGPDTDLSSPVINTATQSSQTPIEGNVDHQNNNNNSSNNNNSNQLIDDQVTCSTVSAISASSSSDTIVPLPTVSSNKKSPDAKQKRAPKKIVKNKTKKQLKLEANNSDKPAEIENVTAEADKPEDKEIVKKESPKALDQAKKTPKPRKTKKKKVPTATLR